MKLSQNFKLEEFYASDVAKLSGINNKPNEEHIVNITRLHDNCMLQIRMNLKMPVIISSGYRCKKLNNKIGGVSNSQHLEGKAVDFTVKGKSNKEVFEWCRKNLEFDQLILEKVNNYEWVHLSYNFEKNRKQVLQYDGKNYKKV